MILFASTTLATGTNESDDSTDLDGAGQEGGLAQELECLLLIALYGALHIFLYEEGKTEILYNQLNLLIFTLVFSVMTFVSDTDNDQAKGLANNELGQYEFIVAVVIWYEVLYAVNLVSKQMQAKDMLIDVAIEKGYWETGFLEALEWILIQHFLKKTN
ncbi:hypothetical protein ACJX0J_040896 [Zea mays]